METKKAVVRTATFKTQFAGKYGQMFVHDVEFENGDKGQYLSKAAEQTNFVVGKEAEYTIETTQFGQYTNIHIKPVKAFQQSKGYQRVGNEALALSYAKDVIIAHAVSAEDISKQVIRMAELFYDWLESKKANQNV